MEPVITIEIDRHLEIDRWVVRVVLNGGRCIEIAAAGTQEDCNLAVEVFKTAFPEAVVWDNSEGVAAYYARRKMDDHGYNPGSHEAAQFERGWGKAWYACNVSEREPGEESDNEMARRIARECGGEE